MIEDTTGGFQRLRTGATGCAACLPCTSAITGHSHGPGVHQLCAASRRRDTVRIAIGDNLLTKPWVSDLMRLNKSFIVKRSVKRPGNCWRPPKPGQLYPAFAAAERPVWIAQREGGPGRRSNRAAVIKMLAMSRDKASQTLASTSPAWGIVPVAISYELDPVMPSGPTRVVPEATAGHYLKGRQDVASIGQGIAGNKGQGNTWRSAPPDDLADAGAVARGNRPAGHHCLSTARHQYPGLPHAPWKRRAAASGPASRGWGMQRSNSSAGSPPCRQDTGTSPGPLRQCGAERRTSPARRPGLWSEELRAIRRAYNAIIEGKSWSPLGQRQMIAGWPFLARIPGPAGRRPRGVRGRGRHRHRQDHCLCGRSHSPRAGVNKRLVVATPPSPREQFVNKDLPDIRRHSGLDFSFRPGQGRRRYVCLSKLDRQLGHGGDSLLPLYPMTWARRPAPMRCRSYNAMIDAHRAGPVGRPRQLARHHAGGNLVRRHHRSQPVQRRRCPNIGQCSFFPGPRMPCRTPISSSPTTT